MTVSLETNKQKNTHNLKLPFPHGHDSCKCIEFSQQQEKLTFIESLLCVKQGAKCIINMSPFIFIVTLWDGYKYGKTKVYTALRK